MDSVIRKKNRQDGFTLVEVLMAVAILSFGLLAVASMQITAIRGNSTSMDVTEAMDAVQDRVEKLLAVNIGHDDLSSLGSHSETYMDKYQVEWTVQDNTPIINVKTITVTVTWTDRGNTKEHEFEFMRTEL